MPANATFALRARRGLQTWLLALLLAASLPVVANLIEADPTSIDFGPDSQGTTATQTLTLTNR